MLSRTNRLPIIADTNPKSPKSEAYRTLRTNIDFSAIDKEIKTIMVTSAQAGEGKTTTAANLAVVYAQAEKNVLLLDADLRKPALHHAFLKSNRVGLTNLLAGQYRARDVIDDTHIDRLSVLMSGPVPPNPSEILASKRMSALLCDLKEQFDVIIIDTPPIIAVTDAQIVAAKCDGVLLVIDQGKVKREIARKAKARLEHVKANILGVILNRKNCEDKDAYYYYGSSG